MGQEGWKISVIFACLQKAKKEGKTPEYDHRFLVDHRHTMVTFVVCKSSTFWTLSHGYAVNLLCVESLNITCFYVFISVELCSRSEFWQCTMV